MGDSLIDEKVKLDVDLRLRNMFGQKAQIRSELQDGGAFILIIAELNPEISVYDMFALYDEAQSMISSVIPIRKTEPRWMLSFHVQGRTLYANIGGLES